MEAAPIESVWKRCVGSHLGEAEFDGVVEEAETDQLPVQLVQTPRLPEQTRTRSLLVRASVGERLAEGLLLLALHADGIALFERDLGLLGHFLG